MAAPHRHQEDELDDNMPETLDADDALEEVADVEGGMDIDSDDDNGDDREEIILENDSIAYFDAHKGSIFAIAQHPTIPSLIATGGGEGDDEDAPGKGYVFDTSAAAGRPVLPPSYNADPSNNGQPQTTALTPLFALDGHTDSINALAFTLPRGEFLLSGGLDERLRVYAITVDAAHNSNNKKPSNARFVAESHEDGEVNWIAPCPAASKYANTFAVGRSDGSVYVYGIESSTANSNNPQEVSLTQLNVFSLHTKSCTAGAWTPDGELLATVGEDSALYVWDVWGSASALSKGGQTVVSLTAADHLFAVEDGLFSVAIDPRGSLVAVGGGGGAIRIVGLPQLGGGTNSNHAVPGRSTQTAAQSNRPSKAKAKGVSGSTAQTDALRKPITFGTGGVETLAFSPSQPLLAAGSTDGSFAVFETVRAFDVRKLNPGAHGSKCVVRVDFVADAGDGWLLTTCGIDGVVRRWDTRGQAGAARSSGVAGTDAARLVKEWRGHSGAPDGDDEEDGEASGGVLGFVQGKTGERVVTAGDDGLALVFEA